MRSRAAPGSAAGRAVSEDGIRCGLSVRSTQNELAPPLPAHLSVERGTSGDIARNELQAVIGGLRDEMRSEIQEIHRQILSKVGEGNTAAGDALQAATPTASTAATATPCRPNAPGRAMVGIDSSRPSSYQA